MNQAHSVLFVRKATKAKDGKNELLYRHSWNSGFQDLIFKDQIEAGKFINSIKK